MHGCVSGFPDTECTHLAAEAVAETCSEAELHRLGFLRALAVMLSSIPSGLGGAKEAGDAFAAVGHMGFLRKGISAAIR